MIFILIYRSDNTESVSCQVIILQQLETVKFCAVVPSVSLYIPSFVHAQHFSPETDQTTFSATSNCWPEFCRVLLIFFKCGLMAGAMIRPGAVVTNKLDRASLS